MNVQMLRQTKLMITLLNGGKSNGSQVKFQKFYLVIDPYERPEVDIIDCFIKFQQTFRKSI